MTLPGESPAALAESLDAAADLRFMDLCRSPGYPGPDSAWSFHRDLLERVQSVGELRFHHGPTGKLRAFAGWFLDPNQATGVPTTHLMAHRLPGDDGALPWIQDQLRDGLNQATGTPSAMVPINEVAVRRILLSLGLRIQIVDLAGEVDVAWQALEARGTPAAPLAETLPADTRPAELSMRPLQPSDADAIRDLRKRVFGGQGVGRDGPNGDGRFCWFCALPTFLDREHAAIYGDTLGPGDRSLLFQGDRLVGSVMVGFRDTEHHPGGAASMDLMLDPSLRGLGLVWSFYRHAVGAARAAGIRWMKGATAQKPVLHIARVLGRHPTGLTLRKGAPFDEAWFEGWIPM